jgi:hypothetical protein
VRLKRASLQILPAKYPLTNQDREIGNDGRETAFTTGPSGLSQSTRRAEILKELSELVALAEPKERRLRPVWVRIIFPLRHVTVGRFESFRDRLLFFGHSIPWYVAALSDQREP